MERIDARISIIGAGNMGQAVARGMLEKKLVVAKSLTLTNPRLEKLRSFQRLGVNLETDNKNAVPNSEVLVLAVKPQMMSDVLNEIGQVIDTNQLVISLAAGISIASIRHKLSERQPIVRVMPNLCAQIGESMSAWVRNDHVNDQQANKVRRILGAIGVEQEVANEGEIDRFTAICGSGPAYVFHLLELLEDSAKSMGFSEETSRIFARQTFLGSAHLIENSDKTAEELRAQVTSKGGTTEAAFKEFQRGGLGSIFKRGVNAAYRRAIELGNS